MKILGITGGIGSGKSTVTALFEKLGATVVDADKIARQILEKGNAAYQEVVDVFGEDILDLNGCILRKKLAAIVFSDAERLRLLNTITHRHVFHEMQKQIHGANTPLICLDVPLLFSCDFPIPYHKSLAVLADKTIRIARVEARDHLRREEILNRMNSQLSDEELSEKADYCIYNEGDLKAVEEEVKKIYCEMME